MSTAVAVNFLEKCAQILVVEDDLPLASFIGKRLQSERYTVELTHDGQDATHALNTSTYDLVAFST